MTTTTATATATTATATLNQIGYVNAADIDTYERHAPRVLAGTGTGAAMLANRIGIRVQLAIVRQRSAMRHPSHR